MMNDGNLETKSHLHRPNWPLAFSNLHRVTTASLVIAVQEFASCIKLAANVIWAGMTDLTRPKGTIKGWYQDMQPSDCLALCSLLRALTLRGGEFVHLPSCVILGSHPARTKVLEPKNWHHAKKAWAFKVFSELRKLHHHKRMLNSADSYFTIHPAT